jgi:hypothetical protein
LCLMAQGRTFGVTVFVELAELMASMARIMGNVSGVERVDQCFGGITNAG